MQRIKIFIGNSGNKADIKVNEWLEKNPKVEIIDIKYQQSGYDHSVCILYKEN